MNWISVKEKKPENDKEVIVYTKLGNIFVGRYKCHVLPGFRKPMGWGFAPAYKFDFINDEVTHWMPLPEPPKMK